MDLNMSLDDVRSAVLAADDFEIVITESAALEEVCIT